MIWELNYTRNLISNPDKWGKDQDVCAVTGKRSLIGALHKVLDRSCINSPEYAAPTKTRVYEHGYRVHKVLMDLCKKKTGHTNLSDFNNKQGHQAVMDLLTEAISEVSNITETFPYDQVLRFIQAQPDEGKIDMTNNVIKQGGCLMAQLARRKGMYFGYCSFASMYNDEKIFECEDVASLSRLIKDLTETRTKLTFGELKEKLLNSERLCPRNSPSCRPIGTSTASTPLPHK